MNKKKKINKYKTLLQINLIYNRKKEQKKDNQETKGQKNP